MSNNFDAKYIEDLIRKELRKYILDEKLNEKEDKKQLERQKEKISFLGTDENFKNELEDNFEIVSDAKTLIVSNLSLKNLYNISIGIYTDEYEEKIMNYILSSKEVIILDEGIEYKKYENLNFNLSKKYKKYLEDIKSFGVLCLSKDKIIRKKVKNEKVQNFKLLDLKRIREYALNEQKEIVILKSTIVTSSALDYAKEKGIEIIREN